MHLGKMTCTDQSLNPSPLHIQLSCLGQLSQADLKTATSCSCQLTEYKRKIKCDRSNPLTA